MKHYQAALLALCFLVSACDEKKPIENTEDVAKKTENEQMAISVESGTSITENIQNKYFYFDDSDRRIERIDSYINIIIRKNGLADFSFLSNLLGVERLGLNIDPDIGNFDFYPLMSMTDLEFLTLKGNGVTSLSALENLSSLRRIKLNSTNLKSLYGVESLLKLEDISIWLNQQHLSDISSLSSLPNLENIAFLVGSYNIDFSILKELPHLKSLTISSSGEVDLCGISQLRRLAILKLESNIAEETDIRSYYKGIEEIGKMSSLTDLFLDESITDIGFLANNINLERLELRADQEREDFWEVSLPLDVSPLKNLTNLKRLAIRGFDLQNAEGLDQLPNLEFYSTARYDLE